VQLSSDRGFSFLGNAPLDMRFDPTKGPTAAELIRELDEESLANALWELAEIRSSRRLAKLLKQRADEGRMETTQDLVEATTEVMGPRLRKIASATLPAQALRILVNGELDRLDAFLADLPRTLLPGGRCAIISFHSGEDRRVKRAFRAYEAAGTFELPRRKAYKPGEAEVEDNRRARSARLRVIERRQP
jgi:16S rRNA (cytosine1402-N4)-methyltransferase